METLIGDLRFGFRSLTKRPLFLFVALMILALGIGGATTIYTIAIGMVLALAGVRVISGFLFGVSPLDPATYVLGGFLLLLVSACASFIPARRIAAIDPVVALKAE